MTVVKITSVTYKEPTHFKQSARSSILDYGIVYDCTFIRFALKHTAAPDDGDSRSLAGGRPLGEVIVQQRGVQDVHGDAAGPRQPELLAQPRQAPDSQEAPLTNLITLKATSITILEY